MAISDTLWRLHPALTAHHFEPDRFQVYRHIEYISRFIAPRIMRGGARIIVETPPRHGKSFLLSKWTPAWFLMHRPHQNVLLASYESEIASTWGRAVRNLALEYAGLGFKVADDSSAADRWHTTRGGGMMTSGVGGALTGRGGHLLLIDDPVKNSADADSETIRRRSVDWLQSTFLTRAEPGASIVVLSTRWHQEDLIGFLLSDANENKKDWIRIRLPAICEDEADPLGRIVGEAICPERYNLEALEKIRKSVGSRTWNALFQQRPAPSEGAMIKKDWIQYYTVLPAGEPDAQCVGVDLSFGSGGDYSVFTVWSRYGSNYYLTDLVRGQLDFPAQCKALRAVKDNNREVTAFYIEAAANGKAIIDSKVIPGLIGIPPRGSKEARLSAVAPLFEAKNVHLPDVSIRGYTRALVDELCGFPYGKHDDQVDSLSLALGQLSQQTTYDFELPNMRRTNPFSLS